MARQFRSQLKVERTASSKPPLPTVPRRQTVAVCAGLVLLVLIPFGQVARHKFTICDDNDYIFENQKITDGLTFEGIVWAFDYQCGNWHPLTWMSHMADCQVFGPHEVDGLTGRAAITWSAWPSTRPARCCCFLPSA